MFSHVCSVLIKPSCILSFVPFFSQVRTRYRSESVWSRWSQSDSFPALLRKWISLTAGSVQTRACFGSQCFLIEPCSNEMRTQALEAMDKMFLTHYLRKYLVIYWALASCSPCLGEMIFVLIWINNGCESTLISNQEKKERNDMGKSYTTFT